MYLGLRERIAAMVFVAWTALTLALALNCRTTSNTCSGVCSAVVLHVNPLGLHNIVTEIKCDLRRKC